MGGGACDFAEAFDRRQALCDLRIDGHHYGRLVGGRGIECARPCGADRRIRVRKRRGRNVERVNGLIYAVMMESRGIYLSHDRDAAAKFAEALLKANDQIGAVIADW